MTDTDTTRRRRARPTRADEHLAELAHAVANLNDTADQLRQGMRSINAARQLGATPVPIVRGTSQRLSNSIGRIFGFAIRETTNAATATVRLRDGFDAEGGLLIPINLAANESARDWFAPKGISFSAGLFVEVVSGTIEGTVFLG